MTKSLRILSIGLGVAFLAGVAIVSNAASVSNVPAAGTAAADSIGNITASQDQNSVQQGIDDTIAKAEKKKAEALKQAEQAKQDALKKAEELEKKAEETKSEALKKAQAALEQARQILEQVKNTPAPASEQPSQPAAAAPAAAAPPTISAAFSQTGAVSGTVNVTISAPGVTQLELNGQRNGSLIQKYITVLDSAGNGAFAGKWDTTQTPNGSMAISAAFSFSGGRATQALGSFTINNPVVQSPVVNVEQVIPQPAAPASVSPANVIQNAITSLQDVQQQLKTVTEAPPATSPTAASPTTVQQTGANQPATAQAPETKPALSPRMPESTPKSDQPVTTGQVQPPQPPEIKPLPMPAAEPESKQKLAPEKLALPAAPSVSPTAPMPSSSPAPSAALPTPIVPPNPPAVQPLIPVQPTLAPPAQEVKQTAPPKAESGASKESTLPPAAPPSTSSTSSPQASSGQAAPVNLSSTDPRLGGIPVPAVLKVEAVTLVTAPAEAPAPEPTLTPKPAPAPKPSPPPTKPAPPSEKLVLAGKAIPNAFITLYIYSEPIVIDVRADASGRWEYTLDRRVSDGPHEAYVAITDTTGRVIVKSSPFRFVKVAQAVSVVTAAPTPETILAPDSNFSAQQFTLFMALAVFGAVLLGFVIIASVAKTRQR